MAKQRLHSVRDHTRDALRDFKSLFRHSASKQEADDAIATLRNSLDEWKNEKIDIAIFGHNKDHLQTLRSLMINADDGDVFENLKKVKNRGMSPIKTFKRQSHDKKTVNESPKTETDDGRTFKASTEDDIEDDVERNISSTGGTQPETETANTDTPKMIIFDMDETISKFGRVEKSLQLQKVDAFFSGFGRKLKGHLKGSKTKVKELANKIPVGRACEKKTAGDFEMDNVEIHDLSLATFYTSSVQDVLMGIAVKLEKKKSEAFLYTITGSHHEGILELKTAWMMKRSRTIAALSAAGGAVPVPGVSAVLDVALLLKEFIFFRKQFGLDEVALKRLRKTSGVNQEALEELLKDCACLALDKKTLIELGKRFAVQTAVEEVSRLIPVIGSIVAGGISFYTSMKILNLLINDMKEASLKIGILLECINSEK